MNISALLNNYNELSGEQRKDINTLVAQSLLHIVHNYILTVTPLLVLTVCCRKAHTCTFYDEMLAILFRSWGIVPIQLIYITRNNSFVPVSGQRYYNLILIDSYESFAEIDIVQHSNDSNENEFYYIFLQQRDDMLRNTMLQIFEYCWHHQLINCNVQIQSAQDEIQIFTYYPYSETHCGSVVPRLINNFNGTKLTQPVLFPRKLGNFFGCTLHAALVHKPPFMNLKREETGRHKVSGGIEGQMLRQLSAMMNFTIELNLAQQHNGHHDFFNGTWRIHNEADLCVGGLHTNVAKGLVATATYNYYQTRFVFSIAVSAYELTSMDILLYPFPPNIWVLLGFILLLVILVLYITNKIYAKQPAMQHLVSVHPYLNVLLIFVGLSVPRVSPISTQRTFYTAFMIFTLVIRSIYQGLLFHLIRTNQTKRIPMTIDELIENNYTLILSSSAYAALSEIPAIQKLSTNIVESDNEIEPLNQLVALNRRHYVSATLMEFLYYFYQVNREQEHAFTIIPQDIVSMQLTMYLRKHSFLINEINTQIMWLNSMGIMSAWMQAEYKICGIRATKHRRRRIFGMHELYAIFLFLVIGSFLSVIVFFLELISLKLQQIFHKMNKQ